MSLLTNLIESWELSEASGNPVGAHAGMTLTEVNGPIASADGGRDLEFDSSQYFTIADNASLSIGSQDMQIEAWVKLESKGATRRVCGKFDVPGGVREYSVLFNNASDRFSFIVSADGSAISEVAANTLGSPSTGVWYQILAKYYHTAEVIGIKVNNGTEDTTAHSGGIFDGGAPFRIGAQGNAGATNLMDGIVKYCRVWKGVTLSAEKETYLYNSGSGRAYANWFRPAWARNSNKLITPGIV